MPEKIDLNVWLWKDPECRWKEDVVNFIKNDEHEDRGIILLHCIDVKGFDESLPLTHYALNMAQKFNIFEKERLTFLNSKDLSLALELCLGQLKAANDNLEYEVTDEDVIQFHNKYLEHFREVDENSFDKNVLQLKNFLKQNNCIDLWFMNDGLSKFKAANKDFTDHLTKFKFLILGTPQADIFKKIISLISVDQNIFDVIIETSLDISLHENTVSDSPVRSSSPGINIITEDLPIEDIPVFAIDKELGSASEEYVTDVIIAFLSLLVNSRYELALSKAMVSPVIDLSHKAFTQLKHLAVEKDMPMCQTAISYVTRVRLGGKGYAPPPDCPMLPHMKGLELFVDILNQMQTVIEEEVISYSAVKKLISILKKKLLKCSGEKLKENCVEKVAENLNAIAKKVSEMFKPESSNSSQLCQETLDLVHYFINYINCHCWNTDPKKTLSEKQVKRTPLNLPPLLGYFRSPEDEFSNDTKSIVSEDSMASNNSLVLQQAPVSYFHYSESSSVSQSYIDPQTPSKTDFKGCLKGEEDTVPENRRTYSLNEHGTGTPTSTLKSRKRCILSEITNENEHAVKEEKFIKPKNVNKKPKNSEMKNTKKNITVNKNVLKKESKSKKIPKKYQLVQGQVKITNFFILGKRA
ncbi:PCNA-interacting partner-like [Stegodyphus dumicola]|uniref:PCNA-interacting partner-like n=1 Tax=Stegodyphus dumicola TaxID=202533 RepID=UPI0015AFF232|nr:PCNA-interacting partner-like [Stegodyphus dumicola]XP_035210313.1 PCNA-interacting partner-like [Stegodyphus dumicola]